MANNCNDVVPKKKQKPWNAQQEQLQLQLLAPRRSIRRVLSPLSLEARRDVLGAIQLSLDSILAMPHHTRIRPDASARQSILCLHFQLVGVLVEEEDNNNNNNNNDDSVEALSHVLASLTPRDLTELLQQCHAEHRLWEILRSEQVPSNAARLGILIAIQAYLDTIITLSLDIPEDASTLQSILGVWFPILGLVDNDNNHNMLLESLSEATFAVLTLAHAKNGEEEDGEQDRDFATAQDILERLRTELDVMAEP